MNKVFISYSHSDAAHAKRIVTHLDTLRRDGTIQVWHDRRIQPGEKWRHVIEAEMEDANIALFLVSSSFLASEFCQDVEVPYFLAKHQKDGLLIVPIIVDYCDWLSVPWLSKFNVLPKDGRPVSAHRPQSKAWTQISQAVRNLALQGAAKKLSVKSARKADVTARLLPSLSLGRLLKELPGGTDELFGREDDLKLLDDAFQNPAVAVIAFVAFGGVGKSALVRHWLRSKFSDSKIRFVGCSFYSQGTREHAGTSDQFMVDALRALGDPQPNRGTLPVKGRRLAELIAAEPTIMVLDGLEPLQFGPGAEHREGNLKDPGIREMLIGLLENTGKSLCIVTSRLRLTDPSLQSLHLIQRSLDVLPPAAAREILRHRGVRGTNEELDDAAEYLGRHALALVLAAEYLDTFKEGRVSGISKIPLINEQIRAGRHAKSVMAAYEMSLLRDGNLLDIEVLHLLGLFDRPVLKEWVGALRQEPVIPGVTDEIVRASEIEFWESISRLRQWGLVASPAPHREDELDAHPLIREYFGENLRRKNPAGWRAAHKRLFEYLIQTPKELPDTLAEMTPLLIGLVHACKAGCYHDALRNVYVPRIMRGEEYYVAQKLGALGSLISVLVHFFEAGDWDKPASVERVGPEGLTKTDQIILLTHAGMCLTAARGYAAPEVERCYSHAAELCMSAGESKDLFIALFGLWRHYLVRGDGQKTRGLFTRLYELSTSLENHTTFTAAERVMCTSLYYRGENARAIEHAVKGVGLRRPEEIFSNAVLYLNEPSISCLGYWSMALWHLGYPDEARKKISEAVALSQQLGHAHTLAISLLFDAMLAQFCRHAEDTNEKANELIRLCSQEGFSLWQIAGEVLRGWAQTKLGHKDAGIEQLERSLVRWDETGAKLFRTYWLALLSEVYGEEGQIARGIQAIDEGLSLAEMNAEAWWQSDLFRLKGELLLLLGNNHASAELHFQKAREIAQAQGALSLELRSVISCARLWQKTNRTKEAQGLLQTVYDQIKGGQDTGDVTQARNLLSKLSK